MRKTNRLVVWVIVVFCVAGSSSFSETESIVQGFEEEHVVSDVQADGNPAASLSLQNIDNLFSAYSSQANSLLPIVFPGNCMMPFENRLVFDDLSGDWSVEFWKALKHVRLKLQVVLLSMKYWFK